MNNQTSRQAFRLFQAIVLVAAMLLSAVAMSPAQAQSGGPEFTPSSLTYTFQEDASSTGQVTATGGTVTYAVQAQPAHGYITAFNTATGAFTYIGYEDYNGADTFTVRATNGSGSTDGMVNVTINAVDDPPVTNDDGYYTITTPAYSWTSIAGSGTNQTANIKPLDPDLYGSVVEVAMGFKVAYYGGLYDSLRIYGNGSIQLFNSGDYNNDNYYMTNQVDSFKVASVLAVGGNKYINSSDPTNPSAVYTKANGTTSYTVEFVNLLDNVVPSAPSTFQVILNSNGNILINYNTVNGLTGLTGLTSPFLHSKARAGNIYGGVYLHRSQVARQTGVSYQFNFANGYSANKNTTLTATTALSANDFDPDGGSPTYTYRITKLPTHGTVTLNANQTFSYTPATNYVGRDKFTYAAVQSGGQFMEADAFVYSVGTTGTGGDGTHMLTTSAKVPQGYCNDGIMEGFDALARPFRYVITPPYNGLFTAYVPGHFFQATGEYSLCADVASINETWTGQIDTGATSAKENIAIATATGTVVSGDGLYTLTETAYTVDTQPWDELNSDSGATDWVATLGSSTDLYDEGEFIISLPFDFPINGTTYKTIYPNPNGFLAFDRYRYAQVNVRGKEGLPRSQVNSAIFGVGMNGIYNASTGSYPVSHLYTKTINNPDSSPNRFVIEWYQLADQAAQANVSTFEIVLFPDGRIETRYRAINTTALVAGVQYAPSGNRLEDYVPQKYALNYPAWKVASYKTVAYNLAPYYSTTPNTALVVDTAHGVRANDSSQTSGATDTVTLAVKLQPWHGTVTLNADGSFTYTPAADFSGRDYFVYTAGINSMTYDGIVAIDVLNPRPVISSVDGPTTVIEGDSATFTVHASDAVGETIKYSYSTSDTLPGASINEDTGVFTWPSSVNGSYSVTFRAYRESDPTKYDESTVSFTVNVNQAPVITSITGATGGAVTVNEGSPVTLTVNASDTESDTLTYSMTGDNPGGSFNPATHVFTWTTTEADDGVYTLTFRVEESTYGNTRFDEETVTLTVAEVYELPVFSAPTGSTTINEGQSFALAFHATQQDTLPLTYEITTGPGSIDSSTGAYTWTTGEDNDGSYTLTVRAYSADHPAATQSQTVTLNVTEVYELPVFTAATGSTTVDEGQPVNLTFHATQQDTLTLTYAITTGPGTINSSTGAYTWATTEADEGPHTLTVRAYSTLHTEASQTQTVTLTVNEVNEPPYITSIDGPTSAMEDDSITISVIAGDADSNPLTYAVTGQPSGSSFNSSTGVLTWAKAVPGTYPMTFEVHETALAANKATEAFTLTVAENQSPSISAVNGSTTVDEGQTVTLTVVASDPEGDALTYAMLPNDTGGTFNPATHVYTWATNEASDGNHDVTFRVSETNRPANLAEYTVTLHINEVNEPPYITSVNGAASITEDDAASLAVIAGDADSNPLSYSVTGQPSGSTFNTATGVFAWAKPTPGSYPMTFNVYETSTPSLHATRDVTLVVADVDHDPVIDSITGATTVDEGQTIVLTVNASDSDGDALTYSMGGSIPGGTFDPVTHKFTWITTEADNGVYNVTFEVAEVTHPAQSAQQDVTITVNEINEPPSITSIDGPSTITEGHALTLTVLAADADSNPLAFHVTGLPEGASFDGSTGVLTWDSPMIGVYPMTFEVYEIADPTKNDTQDFTLNVVAYQIPAIDSITGATTANEGTQVALTINAHDPEGGTLAYEVSGLPVGAVYAITGNAFTWNTVETDGPGVYTLTFTVTADGNANRRAQKDVTVTINEVNRLPVLNISGYTNLPDGEWVNAGQAVTFTATATDPDLPANTLSFYLVNAPAGASIDPTTGVFTWTPTLAQGGSDYSFQVRVLDNAPIPGADEETITFKVNALPVFAALPDPISQRALKNIHFVISATDADNRPSTPLAYALKSGLPAGATFDPATRAFDWTPGLTQTGSYLVTFTVTDGFSTQEITAHIIVTDSYKLFFPFTLFGQ